MNSCSDYPIQPNPKSRKILDIVMADPAESGDETFFSCSDSSDSDFSSSAYRSFSSESDHDEICSDHSSDCISLCSYRVGFAEKERARQRFELVLEKAYKHSRYQRLKADGMPELTDTSSESEGELLPRGGTTKVFAARPCSGYSDSSRSSDSSDCDDVRTMTHKAWGPLLYQECFLTTPAKPGVVGAMVDKRQVGSKKHKKPGSAVKTKPVVKQLRFKKQHDLIILNTQMTYHEYYYINNSSGSEYGAWVSSCLLYTSPSPRD